MSRSCSRLRTVWISTVIVLALIGSNLYAFDYTLWTQWHNALQPQGAGTQITLANNGTSNYAIVKPASPTTQDTKAATDLQTWLKTMTGVQLSIITEDTPLNGKDAISIGRTQMLQNSGLPAAAVDLGEHGYGIWVQNTTLFLWGGSKRGAIHAVYALLEEDLGCRWYTSGSASNRIPSRPTLTFTPVDRTYIPLFRYRDPFYGVQWNENWAIRNRTNAANSPVRTDWGGHEYYGDKMVHTFEKFLPPATYFSPHPEYFMMDANGNRQPKQPCLTNADAYAIIRDAVHSSLDKYPNSTIISLSQNDDGGWCLCPNCRAKDDLAGGVHMGSLLYLVNKIAADLLTTHTSVWVDTIAYFDSVDPPQNGILPWSNVIIRYCNANPGAYVRPFTPMQEYSQVNQLVTTWTNLHTPIYVWNYVVNTVHGLAPMPNMEVIAKDLQYLVSKNVKGVLNQAADYGMVERDNLRAWLTAKLMWNPYWDYFQLMQDFIWGHYGQAAPKISEYNELLRLQGLQYQAQLSYPVGGIQYGMDSPFLTKEFLNQSTAIFSEAEQLAENSTILHRVEREEIPIMYVQLERGPDFVGAAYGAILDKYAVIAPRENAGNAKQTWIDAWAAYEPYLAKNPIPADGSLAVWSFATLKWTAGTGATSFDVKFGTTNPPPLLCSQTATSVDLGLLAPNTTYYWRINSYSAQHNTIGYLWSFTTRDLSTFIDLGTTDEEKGLRRAVVSDGDTQPVTIGDREARSNVDPASDLYFYFDVDDAYAYQGRKPDLYITISYFDAGSGALSLAYDATGSAIYQDGGSVTLANTNTWKQHQFHILNAYFGNRQAGGADFRIGTGAGTVFYLDIVQVSQFDQPPGKTANPVPAPQSFVDINATLNWSAVPDAVCYKVYWGTTDPPPCRGSQTATTFSPGSLDYFTDYYWRVDAVNDFSTTQGDTWHFTTRARWDLDADGDVDQEDFGRLQACLTGPHVPPADPACLQARLDNDDDVDSADLAILLHCMNGANVLPDPHCDD